MIDLAPSHYVKQRLLLSSIVLLGLILIFGGYLFALDHGWIHDKEKILKNQYQQVADAADFINSKNFDIMYFGADLDAPANFKVRKIYSFEEGEIYGENSIRSAARKMIIFNDPQGNVILTYDQLLQIDDLIRKRDVVFIYLGEKKIPDFQSVGLAGGTTYNAIHEGTIKSFIAYTRGDDKHLEDCPGFADSCELVPILVTRDLRSKNPDAEMVYSVIMELEKDQFIQHIWE